MLFVQGPTPDMPHHMEPMLFVSPAAHERLYQRHQALAGEFAEAGREVWFMNPIRSGGWGVNRRRLGSNLTLVQAHVPWRATGSPLLQRVAAWAAFSLVRRHFSRPEELTLWIADPGMADGVRFSWKRIAYDRCDRHGFFPGQRAAVWEHYERQLFAQAHAVFCSSPVLLAEAGALGASAPVLLPNAVGSDWLSSPFKFDGVRTGVSDIPEVLKNQASERGKTAEAFSAGGIRPGGSLFYGAEAHQAVGVNESCPSLRLVSSGAHFEWTDFNWLERWANLGATELHLAGEGRGAGFAKLLRHPRVTFHGALDRIRLKALLYSCHIGLVPFIANRLTEAVDPVKVYEYAAAGLRVVGSPVRGLAEHPLIMSTLAASEISDSTLAGVMAQPLPRTTIPTWQDRAEFALRVLQGEHP